MKQMNIIYMDTNAFTAWSTSYLPHAYASHLIALYSNLYGVIGEVQSRPFGHEQLTVAMVLTHP